MTDHMTAEKYWALQRREKRSGRIRGVVPTWVGDIRFDSALEAARYSELVLMQKAGIIADLRRQVKIGLVGPDGPIMTDTGKQQRTYVADFVYREAGVEVIEDAKGFRTETYRLKRAILEAMGFKIREITGSKTRTRR